MTYTNCDWHFQFQYTTVLVPDNHPTKLCHGDGIAAITMRTHRGGYDCTTSGITLVVHQQQHHRDRQLNLNNSENQTNGYTNIAFHIGAKKQLHGLANPASYFNPLRSCMLFRSAFNVNGKTGFHSMDCLPVWKVRVCFLVILNYK